VVVDDDRADHAVGADLGAVRERVGHVRDQRRGLGVDLAALQAEAAVDAVRPVAEPAVADRHGADPDPDAEPLGTADEDLAVAADGVRRLPVAMRVAQGQSSPATGSSASSRS
jgi:hypothetical protein